MTYDNNVLLIYTGGTIGMNRNPHTGALEPFNFEHLLNNVPELEGRLRLQNHNHCSEESVLRGPYGQAFRRNIRPRLLFLLFRISLYIMY